MKDVATIQSEIASNVADNASRQITPAKIRQRLIDVADWLQYIQDAQTITFGSAHSLVSSDVGKPIGLRASGLPAVWDDAATTQTESPAFLLAEVVSTTVIRVARAGDVLQISDTLLPSSMPVTGGDTNSRYLFWDLSAGKWAHSLPNDSQIAVEGIYWLRAGTVAGTSKVMSMLPSMAAHGV